jgi:hypothetical protein
MDILKVKAESEKTNLMNQLSSLEFKVKNSKESA